jgi:hypothetical protein
VRSIADPLIGAESKTRAEAPVLLRRLGRKDESYPALASAAFAALASFTTLAALASFTALAAFTALTRRRMRGGGGNGNALIGRNIDRKAAGLRQDESTGTRPYFDALHLIRLLN